MRKSYDTLKQDVHFHADKILHAASRTPNADLLIYELRESLDLDELAIAEHVLEKLIAGLDEMKHEARRALAALRKMEQRGGEK